MNNEEQPQQPPQKQSVYPDPDAIRQKWEQQPAVSPALAKKAEYELASKDFHDLLVLASGVSASATLFGLTYILKNTWATTIIAAIFALISIVLSMKNYKAGRLLTPLTVIGLCAATLALLYAANILIADMVIRSTLDSVY